MQEIKIKLDAFEGPLDLLLHLCKTLEIDIYDIPIAEVTEQYMGYIHAMENLELEIAGEYLVMAATLMAIKSKMLLPVPEVDIENVEDYEEDPRDSLVAQLVEYRKYKYAAEELSEKEEERRQYYTKGPMNIDEFKEEQTELAKDQLNTIDLFLAFHQMLEKKKKRQVLKTTISADETSIEEKMQFIEAKIQSFAELHQNCTLEDFFITYNKSEVVITFLAMLELMRDGKIATKQEHNYETIVLFSKIGVKEDDKI
ncbi:MAG TPA: segregation/condensation protein A [Candidatus Tetragenococcus pullicola]|nr:segregation/condensation protein A [Candidatus Tetragenococcus pullicola]